MDSLPNRVLRQMCHEAPQPDSGVRVVRGRPLICPAHRGLHHDEWTYWTASALTEALGPGATELRVRKALTRLVERNLVEQLSARCTCPEPDSWAEEAGVDDPEPRALGRPTATFYRLTTTGGEAVARAGYLQIPSGHPTSAFRPSW